MKRMLGAIASLMRIKDDRKPMLSLSQLFGKKKEDNRDQSWLDRGTTLTRYRRLRRSRLAMQKRSRRINGHRRIAQL